MSRFAVAAAVLALAVVPDVALASQGRHGPSSSPLIVELLVAAAVALAVVGRHAAARFVRTVANATADASRALAHRPKKARLPHA